MTSSAAGASAAVAALADPPLLATARLLINAALGTALAAAHVRASVLVRELGGSLLFPPLDPASRQVGRVHLVLVIDSAPPTSRGTRRLFWPYWT